MGATESDGTIVPRLLGQMARTVVNPTQTNNRQHQQYLEYVAGWIEGRSEEEYKDLVRRDGLPSDTGVVKLLCELAIMRALVRWHEVRDRPPPMPTIDAL